MMRCRVLLFAQLAAQIGSRELELDLGDGAVVADALDALCRTYEPIRSMRDRIAVAVNEVYQPLHAPLTEGCVVALIPPVSGG